MATPDFMLLADLVAQVGLQTVTGLFDDDSDGVADTATLATVMAQAEAFAESYMLRGWGHAAIVLLAANDDNYRAMVAWVALEMASERRQEFVSADGKGRYWAQYERSVQYFQALSKSQQQSSGEAAAGANSNSGGGLVLPVSTAPRFTWTPTSETGGRNRGGF